MRNLKSKVEICKLPSMTPVFLLRCREARKLPPSPRWSPSQGIPRKGQAPSRVTPWIALGLPTRKWASDVPSGKPLPDAPRRLHYQAFDRNATGLFPPVHGGGHTTNAVGVVSQDYKPLRCTTIVRASTELSEVCKPH